MSTTENNQDTLVLSASVKEVLGSSLVTLGRFHNGKYVLNRHCLESVKDIIRVLKRDNESHEIRRYLGDVKLVQNNLIHVIKACPLEQEILFDVTLRLLLGLTCSVNTLYGDVIPTEKMGRSIYMNLIEHLQDYKEAFHDIDFWNVICGRLTDLFEIDPLERSYNQCLLIEKMLTLVRNVLQIPADPEREKITENDISVHDQILWSLRQSQILEFLLYVSSRKNERKYCLYLLEIFRFILREQNPKLLAVSEVQRSNEEREKDIKDLLAIREREKVHKNKYKHTRTFDSTFVLEGMKSFSGKDMIYHGSLEDMKELVVQKDKKRGKSRSHKTLVQSELVERRSSFSVRIFLKEFCIEFLNCSYNNLMNAAKEKLLSGKGLPNDEMFYFWVIKFFLEFNCAYNLDIKLISDSVNVQTFHYLQTNMEENFELLISEKKKKNLWVRKLHLILQAYYSLLRTLKWMDSSKDGSVRLMSSVIKSQFFYVAEYRDMALYFLTRYDSDLFSIAYLRDLVEANHLSIKLLEEYTKQNKIVVRKKIRKVTRRKTQKPPEPIYESNTEKWNRIREGVSKALKEEVEFPDIPPFDVLLEVTDEEQKKLTMKNVQKLLHEGKIIDGIGLLRSARQVWPEHGHFGFDGMSVDDEIMALQEICLAELGNERVAVNVQVQEEEEEVEDIGNEGSDEENGFTDNNTEGSYRVSEESFDMMSYKRRLVNKRVVEACAVLLKNYSKNSELTNHCIVKLMFRIGWECSMPAMLYQASLFLTLLTIMNDKHKNYKEINDFTIHLVRKFREHASKRRFTFFELFFWKEPKVALEIQGDETEPVEKKGRKAASWSWEEEEELQKLWLSCDPNLPKKKKVEWIKSNLIDTSKSLESIKSKLREFGLFTSSGSRIRNDHTEWSEEEVQQLKKYFEDFHDWNAVDIVDMIYKSGSFNRTKKSIREQLLELGLVDSMAKMTKKTQKKRRVLDALESSDDNEYNHDDNLKQLKMALAKTHHLKPALEWLKQAIVVSLKEEGDGAIGECPVPPSEEQHIEVLVKAGIMDLLSTLDVFQFDENSKRWSISKDNKENHENVIQLLTKAIEDDFPTDNPEDSPNKLTESLGQLSGISDGQFEGNRREKMSKHWKNGKNKPPVLELSKNSDDEANEVLRGSNSSNRSFRKSGANRRRLRIDSDSDSDVEAIQPSNKDINTELEKTTEPLVPDIQRPHVEKAKILKPIDFNKNPETDINEIEKQEMRKSPLHEDEKTHTVGSDSTPEPVLEFDKLLRSQSPAMTKVIDYSSDEEMIIRRIRTNQSPSNPASHSLVDDENEKSSPTGKRRRFISSDSDVEEDGSGSKTGEKKVKTTKKLRIIDSDSDSE